MHEAADRPRPELLAAGRRAQVGAILARIGPPYARMLADEEYAVLCRRRRLLGCGEALSCEREGEVCHEWTFEGRALLRMYGHWLPQGAERALWWLSVE